MRKMWKKAAVLAATIALSCGAMSISSYAGWQQNETGWWYQNDDNSYAQNGWQQINGRWYLFNAEGYMLTGWQNVNGTWYYMEGSGAMLTGWQNINGTWYYMNGSGAMLTGWQNIGGTWYYMNGSGAMLTGWQGINGKGYCFAPSGAMLTGWHEARYMLDSGEMLRLKYGIIDGTEYFFDEIGFGHNIAMSEGDYDAYAGTDIFNGTLGDIYAGMNEEGNYETYDDGSNGYIDEDGYWTDGTVLTPEEQEELRRMQGGRVEEGYLPGSECW